MTLEEAQKALEEAYKTRNATSDQRHKTRPGTQRHWKAYKAWASAERALSSALSAYYRAGGQLEGLAQENMTPAH